MNKPAMRICNNCSKVVAVKNFIRYYTTNNYITLRADDVTSYVNMEDNTTKYKLHYCCECWDKICRAATDLHYV